MKRLVVCFDGTWNNADSGVAETNVARMARAVRATSGDVPQLTLYLRGVGSTGIALQKLIEGATGEGIDDNIRSAYMFLAQNYLPPEAVPGYAGDEIFVFGFSRGAFSARSLAGFVSSCGLLKRQRLGSISDAWNYYRKVKTRSPDDFAARLGGDAPNHPDVTIAFLGVWDTVGALGIPGTVLNRLTASEYQFHDTKPSRLVRIGRHALAIDEHRDEFEPTLWTGPAPAECDIQQVWFPGAHSDVGGGYQQLAGMTRLANAPLRWMADEAAKAGLALDEAMLPEPVECDPLAPHHESRLNLSRKDRLTPTIRQMMGCVPEVSLLERLYQPMSEKGVKLQPVNESLHPSAVDRFGQSVLLLANDADQRGERITYSPKNLRAALGQ
jgi:uncharacterized protein (DUF2235 family)